MKLPRFQFRLRTLLIVVALLAVMCAFVGWQAKIVTGRKGWLNSHAEQVFVIAPDSVFARGDREQSPSHLRVWFGDERRDWIAVPETASITEKQSAASLFPEADVVQWPLEFSGPRWREYQKRLMP
jgi:hypothetical protein